MPPGEIMMKEKIREKCQFGENPQTNKAALDTASIRQLICRLLMRELTIEELIEAFR
jgi:hypothetical protein